MRKHFKPIIAISLIMAAILSIFISFAYIKRPQKDKVPQTGVLPQPEEREIEEREIEEREPKYIPGDLIVKIRPEVKKNFGKVIKCRNPKNALYRDSKLYELGNYEIREVKHLFPNCTFKKPHLTQRQKELVKKREEKMPWQKEYMPKIREKLSRVLCMKCPPETDMESLCKEIEKLPYIEYCEPNYICHATDYPIDLPNDTYVDSDGDNEWSFGAWGQDYEDMWGLRAIDIRPEVSPTTAWPFSEGEGVVVAVVDTGIDYTHEDLEENIWINPGELPLDFDIAMLEDYDGDGVINLKDLFSSPYVDNVDNDANGFVDDFIGWDFVNNDNNPFDDHYHGTHVAGTIAAVGNNGKGIIGVAPKARLMGLKGLDYYDGGSISGLVDCIEYAVNNGARVLNNSWSGPGESRLLNDIIKDAHYISGSIVVAAAGDNNDNARYYLPGNINEAITVAAMDPSRRRAFYSNWGSFIDVIAPGTSILSVSSSSGMGMGIDSENKYLILDGTSMAAPHVSGLAALILSTNPFLTSEQVNQIIRQTAIPMGIAEVGYGLINIYDALQMGPGLECRITSPRTETILNSPEETVEIKGIVAGSNFGIYFLEYKREGEEIWNPIVTADTTQHPPSLDTDGNLIFDTLGFFNTFSLPEGDYTIRLLAFLAIDIFDSVFQDRVILRIDYSTYGLIRLNLEREGYNNREIININGSVPWASSDQPYNLSWGRGEDPREWSTEGILLENDGMVGVIDGTLGSLNSAFLPEPGWYTLKLEFGLLIETEIFYIDPYLLTGWPQRFREIGSNTRMLSYPLVGELDEDDYQEVVWKNNFPFVYIWDFNGRLDRIESIAPSAQANILSLANLDSDPALEIISPEEGGINFLNADGTSVKRIESDSPVIFSYFPVIINDIDYDGDLEVIATGVYQDTSDCSIYVWDFNTAELLFPGPFIISDVRQPIEYSIRTALGDLDNDGIREIIVGATLVDGIVIYAFRPDGSIMDGVWPVTISTPFMLTKIITADINTDNRQEIIVCEEGQTHIIYNSEGSLLSTSELFYVDYFKGTAISNIDSDDHVEIVTPMLDRLRICQIERDGSISLERDIFTGEIGMDMATGVSLADIDNDNWIEIIVSGYPLGDLDRNVIVQILRYNPEVDVWENIRSYSPPFDPRRRVGDIGSPFIIDLDRDGYTDIGVTFYSSNEFDPVRTRRQPIQIWETGASYRVENMKWIYKDFDLQHTNCLTPENSPFINMPPEIVPIGPFSVDVGDTLTFSLNVRDPDRDTFLTLTHDELPLGADFDTTRIEFTWTPTPDQVGTYTVTFTVSDGELTDSEVVVITVNEANRPPVLDPIGDKTVDEGETLTFTVTATDPDGDPLTYTIDGLSSGAEFDDQTFTWTPTYDQAGTYTVTFTVSDGSEEDSVAITITVNNVNRPPILNPIGSQRVRVGSRLLIRVSAIDPDGDSLSYSATDLPRGARFTSRIRLFMWNPRPGQEGTYFITFTVTDNGTPALPDSEIVRIDVIPRGRRR